MLTPENKDDRPASDSARSAARCERYLTALEACDAAIELQPDAVKTQRQRCECLVELRDFSTALRQLGFQVELCEEDGAHRLVHLPTKTVLNAVGGTPRRIHGPRAACSSVPRQ